jgi:hypothetical protein
MSGYKLNWQDTYEFLMAMKRRCLGLGKLFKAEGSFITKSMIVFLVFYA